MIRNTHLTGSPAAVAQYMESKHEEHMTRSGEVKATGYYSMSGGAPSEWFGKGAEAQGLAGAVVAEDMVRALGGTVKHTGEDISTRGGQTAESRRMGEELTIAAPKSVSIMSVEDPRIIEAHQRAARAAMQYVEQEMVHARIGKGGGKGNDFSGNLTAGLYVHEDARDSVSGRVAPHLHTHAIISNMTQRSDGQWVGLKLDWGHNNEKKMAADAVYKAELAREVKALGYQIEKGKGADFEIAGITRQQIEYFSPRSQDIKKEIGGDRDGVSPKERQAAQNKTKGNKSSLSQIDQRYAWRREFREQNMDLHAIHDRALRREATGIPASQITAADAVKSAIRHLSERDSVFSESALKSEALASGLGDISYVDVQKAIQERAGGLVSAGKGEGLNERQFTTKHDIYREAEILKRAESGKGQGQAIIDIELPETTNQTSVVQDVSFTKKELSDGKRSYQDTIGSIKEAEPLAANSMRELSKQRLDANEARQNPDLLSSDAGPDRSRTDHLRRSVLDERVAKVIHDFESRKGFNLGDGQKNAVALALTSADRHMAIVGAAGAGKTTAMELIVDEYRKAGYEIIGVAPSAAAAKELQSAGCDDTRTLASSLLKHDKEGETPDKRLYIMDESGMVSAKDMDAFLRKVDAEGARSLFVGDPLQLASVEAGSPYAQLLKTGSIAHANIDEIQRQRDPQLRAIAQAFARGDAEKGVELAQPYMTQVKPTEEDWAAAEATADKNGSTSSAKATEKMIEFAKDHGWKGGDDFAEVRKFLDEKAYEIGGLDVKGGAGPNAPRGVRQEALARSAAEAYLDLSPDERSKTLLLASTNGMRQSINEKIRAGLVTEGTLGDQAAKITGLDKLDLTRESATHAENYVNKEKDDKNQHVVVQFNADLKSKDSETPLVAEKGSQWNVIGTSGGKLQLQSREDPEKLMEIRPTEARISAYTAREMELRVGDQIMFRQNDKALGVTNGTQGKVVNINEKNGKITVETQAGERVTIEKDRAETIDYSYARTVHSAQGATVARAIVVGEASRVATAAAAYVALSREKLGLQIITDNIEKLSKAWSKFATRQNALDAAKTQAPETLNEIRQARQAADYELGQAGDLAEKRSLEVEPEQEREGEPEPEHAAYQFSSEPEAELELGS
jgi:conjugative relaxase-like TrwC/TraI family protein